MSRIKAYTENKELRFSVTIGRKTFKGFKDAKSALHRGIEEAQALDKRAVGLLRDKPFDRQVAMVYGPEIADKYIYQSEGV